MVEKTAGEFKRDFDKRKKWDDENLHSYNMSLLDLGKKTFPNAGRKVIDDYIRQ